MGHKNANAEDYESHGQELRLTGQLGSF